MPILRIEGLTKHFVRGFRREKVKALEDLHLEVEKGEIFGFLGPNGAGKTTTIKLLLRLIYPTAGKAWILDKPIEDRGARRFVGYMPENPNFYRFLTGEEFLHFFGRLNGLDSTSTTKKATELIRMVGMERAARMRIAEYSRGMVQRIGLAQAMLKEPKVILLDEPLSGLDPIGRAEIRDFILKLRERGTTVFFCSHILSDVESICERVAILNRGHLLRTGTISELMATGKSTFEAAVRNYSEADIRTFEPLAVDHREHGGVLHLRFDDPVKVKEFTSKLSSTSAELVSLNEQRESLESYFMRVIGEAGKN
jgi:ABC-2 type transport system ATP-binding protein